MKSLVLIIVLVACTVSVDLGGQQNGVFVRTGFIRGRDFLAMSVLEQRRYASGLFDGMLLVPLFGGPTVRLNKFANCVGGMDDGQLAAILKKHLQDKPELWHEGANTTLFNALVERCPQ